ncbi:MAG: cytochrome b N-terminal domain-containing protein [Nitrospirota bacterium]
MKLASTLADRLSLGRHYRRIFERKLPPGVTYFYCFGGITLFMFIVLTFTGIVLSLYYIPAQSEAYASIRFIDEKIPLGWLMRSMHVWSATGMVAFVMLHMIRVYVTGSYKDPREMNWVVGMFLFVLTMAFGFSGYLLPWDQKAYWATTVGTAMPGTVPLIGGFLVGIVRGGADVTGITLIRFYVLHVYIFPVISMLLLWAHFHMIRRQGISGGL